MDGTNVEFAAAFRAEHAKVALARRESLCVLRTPAAAQTRI